MVYDHALIGTFVQKVMYPDNFNFAAQFHFSEVDLEVFCKAKLIFQRNGYHYTSRLTYCDL